MELGVYVITCLDLSLGLFIVTVAVPLVFPHCDFRIELIPGDLHVTSVVIANIGNDSFCLVSNFPEKQRKLFFVQSKLHTGMTKHYKRFLTRDTKLCLETRQWFH